MKILQISDVHKEINKANLHTFGFINQLKDVDVLAICGDISGSYSGTFEFLLELQEYIETEGLPLKCIAVAGNHESYDSSSEHTYRSEIINKLRDTFNKGSVFFCENDFVDVGENTLVYGCCLYTNFGYNMYNERMALRSINDFRYSLEYDVESDVIRPVYPQDYQKWFEKSVKSIDEFCDKYKDKNIVLVTHFGMSPKSVSPKYFSSQLNSFYTSNLEWLIEKHPNIKLVLQGHTHSPLEYKIGECTVSCNPCGYCIYDEDAPLRPEDYKGKIITL